MSKEGLAAVDEATAVTKHDHDKAVAAAREEGRKAGLAEAQASNEAVVSAARKDGATAERERILGIEKAALPGHDKLVADLKANPEISVGEAALQINTAERGKLGDAKAAIAGVETTTGKVTPAPSAERTDDTGGEKATTPEGWKAEYAASAKLQGEFPTEAAYVAFKQAEAAGKVKRFAPRG